MNNKLFTALALGVTALVSIQEASAHVGWRGRDLMTDAISTTSNLDGSTTYHYDRGNVTSNWGWMDGFSSNAFPFGAYNDKGDSHRVRFTKFYLDLPSWVDITVSAQDFSRNTANDNTVARLGDLNPAFSIYWGGNDPYNAPVAGQPWRDHNLVPQSSHDWPPVPNAAALGYEGLFVANGDITMATNGGEINTQYFTGHSAATLTGNTVSLFNVFLANAGWYSVVVGGSNFNGIPYVTNNTTYNPNVHGGSNFPYLGQHADLDQLQRGFGVDLTVRPIPVPAAVWLLASGLVSLIGMRRRAITA